MPYLEIPFYDAAAHLPPPPPLPTATISPKGVLYLSKAFMQALNLGNGQAIGLVPPMPGSKYWHLDLRASAASRITWSGSTRERARGQSARARGIDLPQGLLAQNLTLHLLPGKPHYPHFYPLLPADAFTPHLQAPPLAA